MEKIYNGLRRKRGGKQPDQRIKAVREIEAMAAKKAGTMFTAGMFVMLAAVIAVVWGALFGVIAHADEPEERAKSKPGDVCAYDEPNAAPNSFHVPTQVYSKNGEFYLADAYNQQVLHSRDCSSEPGGWSPVGINLFRPHAIASDGELFMAVDTDNDRVVTYARTEIGYEVVECFEHVGVRPHYVTYDASTRQFYVWSSMTGTMYIYKRSEGLNVTLRKTAYIAELDGHYTRSFTIDGSNIYFPSMGKNAIYVVNKRSFRTKAVYGVGAELGGMVQIRHEQGYYYLVTSSDASYDQTKATIVRSKTLSGFGDGSYEDVRNRLSELDGIPYYIEHLEDGHYYTPIIEGKTDPYICRFDIVNGEITNVVNYKYRE
ncbi:MAG: hypothetical protein IJ794_08510 [Lachnospiraceae bacterium]|nr:hypothetical protein [Lachnospiraceae bacterium]